MCAQCVCAPLLRSHRTRLARRRNRLRAAPLPFAVGKAKTFEAWVSLATLDQSASGIFSIQTLDGDVWDGWVVCCSVCATLAAFLPGSLPFSFHVFSLRVLCALAALFTCLYPLFLPRLFSPRLVGTRSPFYLVLYPFPSTSFLSAPCATLAALFTYFYTPFLPRISLCHTRSPFHLSVCLSVYSFLSKPFLSAPPCPSPCV